MSGPEEWLSPVTGYRNRLTVRQAIIDFMKAAVLLLLPLLASGALQTDIEFASPGGFSLTLDAWVPEGPGPFPAVVIVHGGSFVRGDKQTYVKPLFEPLTQAGFAWFTINYRLAPQHRFPAAVDDVRSAVAWVRKNAAKYKVDPARIALAGESAGGHLVSFAGAQPGPDSRVAAVVSFYGPHDFTFRAEEFKTVPPMIEAFTGVSDLDPEGLKRLRQASPATFVSKAMPPYLLIHGTADATVPYAQSVEMCQSMEKAGASCELYTVEGAGHGVGSWENETRWQAYKAKMVEWLKARLRH
jgi:acetyl esterase